MCRVSLCMAAHGLWQRLDLDIQFDLDIPRLNLVFSRNDLFYSRVETWSDIPLEIRTSPTIATFKRKLKAFLRILHPSLTVANTLGRGRKSPPNNFRLTKFDARFMSSCSQEAIKGKVQVSVLP